MTEYHLLTANLPALKGKKSVFPRLVSPKQTHVKDLLKKICISEDIPFLEAEKLIDNLFEQILHSLSEGGTIKIENFGTFSISLSKQKTNDGTDINTVTEPTEKIVIHDIRFKADKKTMNHLNQNCSLVCIDHVTTYSSDQYNLSERVQLALDYLKKHYVLTVKEYCKLTGLQHSKAAKELKKLAETPHSGISCTGQQSHKIYILETKQEQE